MKNGTFDSSAFVKPAGINASSWMLIGPDHWNRKRLKFLCGLNPARSTNLRNGIPDTVSFLPMELAREGSPHFEAFDKPFDEVSNGFTAFADGDVLVAKITPCFENGKGGICSNLTGGIGFGSTEFHVLRPSPTFPRSISTTRRTETVSRDLRWADERLGGTAASPN